VDGEVKEERNGKYSKIQRLAESTASSTPRKAEAVSEVSEEQR
jgi:hypothetical protein